MSSVSTNNKTVTYAYANDSEVPNNKLLSSITSPSGTVYNFTYDNSERVQSVKIGNNITLSTNTYTNNLLSSMQYGNGGSVGYTYDALDRVTAKSYNNNVAIRYKYDKKGLLASTENVLNNLNTEFEYDLTGRLLHIKASNGTRLSYRYDEYNRTSFIKSVAGGKELSYSYVYGNILNKSKNLIYGVTLNGNNSLEYDYDGLSRLKRRVLSAPGYVTEYAYLDGADATSTTTLVSSVKNGEDELEYTYDDVGNIETISVNGVLKNTYHYDALNQLVREDNVGVNTVVYAYSGGNITRKTTYAYTDPEDEVSGSGQAIEYGYSSGDWKDLLTGYNGQTITYDAIGNPLTYRDGFAFTWANGRQLTAVTQNNNEINYLYDGEGLRTKKTVGEVDTDYYWLNNILLGQKTGDEYIIYLYDENGAAYGMLIKNGETETYYYYIFNVQGDVIGIVDSTGERVVSYEYDSWGKVTAVTGTAASTIGQKNPIRYRGYYYDNETGFYYLQSRYYDPETGRFINADGYVSTGQGILGNNMFAYCGNNPIICADSTGQFWGIVVGVALVVGLVATLSGCSKSVKNSSSSSGVSSSKSSSSVSTTPKKNYNDYLGALRSRESSNNYSAVNKFGYLGAYQMGSSALQDAGFKNSSGGWTKTANGYGVYNSSDFLNTPTAQDAAITAYNKKMVGYIKYYGLDTYIGTSYCGVSVTKSGLLASCHLVGVGTMKKSLASGAIAWDGNGVEASEYMSLFSGYDISEVW